MLSSCIPLTSRDMFKSALITVVTSQGGADLAKLCLHEGGEATRVTHRTSLSDSDRADPIPQAGDTAPFNNRDLSTASLAAAGLTVCAGRGYDRDCGTSCLGDHAD